MFALGTEVNTAHFDNPTEQSIKLVVYDVAKLFAWVNLLRHCTIHSFILLGKTREYPNIRTLVLPVKSVHINSKFHSQIYETLPLLSGL